MKRDTPALVIVLSYDTGDINEIPIDDRTIFTIGRENEPVATYALKGVTNLVLTEAAGLGLDP